VKAARQHVEADEVAEEEAAAMTAAAAGEPVPWLSGAKGKA
jgi:hypothetical protein